MKRGHGEAAPGYSLWVLGLRVVAEVAEDAGDGQGDNKEHCHHSDHCRLHGFRVALVIRGWSLSLRVPSETHRGSMSGARRSSVFYDAGLRPWIVPS